MSIIHFVLLFLLGFFLAEVYKDNTEKPSEGTEVILENKSDKIDTSK